MLVPGGEPQWHLLSWVVCDYCMAVEKQPAQGASPSSLDKIQLITRCADHIVAVYEGGGLCDLENLRTLCVCCHAEVTRAQAKERAALRKRCDIGILPNQSTNRKT